MVKFFYSLFFICIIFFSLTAQERVLLHIGRDGKQEAIPLGKNERTQDAIARFEQMIETRNNNASAGTIDSIKYYPGTALDVAGALNTNFGWTHQDVALQWYTPEASGVVKEFWWRNHLSRGNINKGTIRAWYVDPKLANRPASVGSKYLGYYKDPSDGDGLVTPFKPTTGDQWFYGNGLPDSATWNFDPLGTEAPWLPGGLQVSLDSGKWQGIKLGDYGDTMNFSLGQLFGFTLSNDSKVTFAGVQDVRMEILSWPNANPAPFHSYKWYEVGRAVVTGTPPTRDAGWHMRGDYEWGMFVVVEYISVPPPKITLGTLGTTLNPGPRQIWFDVITDNPGGVYDTVIAYVFHKNGALSKYDSIKAMKSGAYRYYATLPPINPGDTMYWYVVVTEKNGYRLVYGVRTYKIFKKNNSRLLIYNNASFSEGNARLIYLGGNVSIVSGFDFWSTPGDGTTEMDTLLSIYNTVIIGDGSFPARNIYPFLEKWFESGTPSNKRNLFFTSQDFGCFFEPKCADKSFSSGDWQYDYLGLEKIGPQDLLGDATSSVQKAFQLVPQPDSITKYLIQYNSDSSTMLYYHPYSQLNFSSYPDAMTPRATAKSIFKDHTGEKTLGVIHRGETFITAFFGFDAGYAMQFRSDTSVSPLNDPKFRRVNSVKTMVQSFLEGLPVTNVEENENTLPFTYSLAQNYPNPFNPSTTIEFSLPEKQNVQISIFNILGQKITTVVNEQRDAGNYTIRWDAGQFSSGIYFYEMRSGNYKNVKKMILMK